MVDTVRLGRCQYPGCRGPASALVITYPGAIEHRVCEVHRQQARRIATWARAGAYRVRVEQPGRRYAVPVDSRGGSPCTDSYLSSS
jgi:hypothetical protein